VGRIGIEQRLDSVAAARASTVGDEVSVPRFESAARVAHRDVGHRKLSHEHRPLRIEASTAQDVRVAGVRLPAFLRSVHDELRQANARELQDLFVRLNGTRETQSAFRLLQRIETQPTGHAGAQIVEAKRNESRPQRRCLLAQTRQHIDSRFKICAFY